jgi:hypothetical protein
VKRFLSLLAISVGLITSDTSFAGKKFYSTCSSGSCGVVSVPTCSSGSCGVSTPTCSSGSCNITSTPTPVTIPATSIGGNYKGCVNPATYNGELRPGMWIMTEHGPAQIISVRTVGTVWSSTPETLPAPTIKKIDPVMPDPRPKAPKNDG